MSAVRTTAEAFEIKETERAVLVGKTGCGKSTLAKALLSVWPHVVVIDPKGEFAMESRYGKPRIVEDPARLSRLKENDPSPILYRPAPRFWEAPVYDGVFRWIYDRQHCTIYTDEEFAVMDGLRAPFWQKAVLTRGRSRHIRSLTATQRPFRVPIELLSEAEHYFCFQLTMRDDKKRMAELMGEEVLQPLSDMHSFYYTTSYGDEGVREFILKC